MASLLTNYFDKTSLEKAVSRPTLGAVDPQLSEVDRKRLAESAAKMRAARPLVRARGGKKSSEVSTILNFTSSFSTVAATDNTTVISLKCSDSTEWSNLIQIWDEVIVDSGKLEFTVTETTNHTTTNGANRAVIAFDPLDASALASLSNGLQHQQHMSFTTPQTTTGQSANMTFPLPMTKNGVYSFPFRIPRGSARSASAAATFGHEWSSTGDASDIYGYLKWYIPQAGATGVWAVYWTWTLRVRFRCRT